VDTDKKYMQRCLQLAAMSSGTVAPNPMVGCVIVRNDTILAESYHIQYGGPHAEVNAISQIKDKEVLKQCTLYVNLEPCSHYGKTPPCADLIVSLGIPRVVTGMADPNPLVAGRGIAKLKEAGVEVINGIAEDECRWLNRRFVCFHEKHRPYVLLKWAQSLDGYIDKTRTEGEAPHINWISHEYTRILVHKWRSEEQAVMTGARTVLMDNPQLSVRDWAGPNPVRIVIDSKGSLPSSCRVFDTQAETWVFAPADKFYGANVRCIVTDFKGQYQAFILDTLYSNNIISVMIEGGSQTIAGFAAADLWDEARVFTGHHYFFGGVAAPRLLKGSLLKTEFIGEDLLATLINS
jgi:diaminohydroxyphosphoribosylaminopyrimidine deaminase/5-amino-6-(5-phosphoribosylamino)uracil reductase